MQQSNLVIVVLAALAISVAVLTYTSATAFRSSGAPSIVAQLSQHVQVGGISKSPQADPLVDALDAISQRLQRMELQQRIIAESVFEGPIPTGYNSAMSVSSSCGTGPHDLVIGILTSPTERSKQARADIRASWMKLPTGDRKVAYRFLLAINTVDPDAQLAVQEEAAKTGDIVFLSTEETYTNLPEKVRLWFKWVVDHCAGFSYIMKVDDDTFLHIPALLGELEELPRTRLVYGAVMRNMPAGKEEGGKMLHDPDNYMNMTEFPNYVSGAGYIMTPDVAQIFAYPPLPLKKQAAEDRRMGMVLHGFDVKMVHAKSFYPWGHCHKKAVLIHYNRDGQQMLRRYNRILQNEDICGAPFATHERCYRSEQLTTMKIACNDGETIRNTVVAAYGKMVGFFFGGGGPLVSLYPGTCANTHICFYAHTLY